MISEPPGRREGCLKRERERGRQTDRQIQITELMKPDRDSVGVGGQIYVAVREEISGSKDRWWEKEVKRELKR